MKNMQNKENLSDIQKETKYPEYIKEETKFPLFMMYPYFLNDLKISETTKILYVQLLNRARLSKENYNKGWHDDGGRVFLNFTIESLAKVMHKSVSTIKNCLRELRKEGLIETIQTGFCKPNRIYVKLPNFTENNKNANKSDIESQCDEAEAEFNEDVYEDIPELDDDELPF